MRIRPVVLFALLGLALLAPTLAGAQFFRATFSQPGFYFSVGNGPYYAPYYYGYPSYYGYRPRRFYRVHRWRHDRGLHRGWFKHRRWEDD